MAANEWMRMLSGIEPAMAAYVWPRDPQPMMAIFRGGIEYSIVWCLSYNF